MVEIITLIAILICLISIYAIIFPGRVLRAVKKITITTPLRILAFIIRILLGLILIFVAESSQFPLTLKIIGVLIVASGIMVILVSNEWIQSIINWFVDRGLFTVRIAGIFAIIFGTFLIYALTY